MQWGTHPGKKEFSRGVERIREDGWRCACIYVCVYYHITNIINLYVYFIYFIIMHILIFSMVYITSYMIGNVFMYNIYLCLVLIYSILWIICIVLYGVLHWLCISDFSMNTHDHPGLPGKCRRDSLLPQGRAHLACKRPHMQGLVWPPPIMPGGSAFSFQGGTSDNNGRALPFFSMAN